MKKTMISVLLLLLLISPAVFSLGIGGAVGFDPLVQVPGTNILLTAKCSSLPLLFGIGFTVWENIFHLGIITDFHIFNPKLFEFINLYFGPGLYIGLNGGDGSFSTLIVGGRIPIGLSIQPLKWFEIYLESAFLIALGINDLIFPTFGLQNAIGVRFWIQ